MSLLLRRLAPLALVLGWTSAANAATWQAADLDGLTRAFTFAVSDRYQVQQYPWAFLDVSNCFSKGKICFGSNPDSPYGAVDFGETGPASPLTKTGALVLIMETPPAMRYFGVTPYIFSRYYASLPGRPNQSGVIPVFESLHDTLNETRIGTAGAPNGGVFGQLAAVVITADTTTKNQVSDAFTSLSFPASAVNQLTLPLTDVPLQMGKLPTDDTFSVLMRVAYPNSPDQLKDYIQRAPVRALVLTPNRARASRPLPTPQSIPPGSGTAEDPVLQTARDQLVAELLAKYGNASVISELPIKLRHSQNYVCVQLGISCAGDNPDAQYASDLDAYVPQSRQDKILFVGVNHVSTGKATYLSHSVVNTEHQAGVAAENDGKLQGSALAMAGITDSSDPRYVAYQQLYAFAVSYDCSGVPVCLAIPEPTADNPVGVAYGDAFDLTSRYYVDPATGTRPSESEVIPHRAFLLKAK